MSILGNRVLRKEDPKFLTTGGVYADDLQLNNTDDLDLEGALYVTYVRSTMAHARVAALDTDEARKTPGVVDVVVGADIDLPPAPPMLPMLNMAMTRPWLATDVVRYVGEPVAAILSEDRASGADAAELVFIDYEP
ncbi:MAG TPA: xanthine dehydrogenase family protein molybdopterin-binding subunit, partial [Acidimicrobiales bacterium]|nr:xanthine dehydrogenase family protein molybdopterin-binding subunit [Acidimicrobiales bacterium]